MHDINLFLFGPPRIVVGANRVDTGLRKSTALLAFLALSQQAFDREAIATMLWPEIGYRSAMANLRRAIYRVQRSIGADVITGHHKSIEINKDIPLWVDVLAFQQLSASTDPPDVCQLEQAADLYTADFLAGFSLHDAQGFDEWHFFQAEALRRSLALVLERLVEHNAAEKDLERAIPYARRWVALDDADEKAQRRLISLYAQSEQVPAALRQYEEFRQRLRREFNLEPDEETAALYETIRKRQTAGPERLAPELRLPVLEGAMTPGHFHNLPAQPSVFIGRETELEKIHCALVEDSICRLITIVGPSGIGKTRLALEASYRALHSFEDGACFIPLAPLAAPEHIAPAIIEQLGLNFYDDRFTEKYLLNALRDRQMLLVLDNAELLRTGMDLITRILQSAPGVKVLVTSSDHLNLTGEQVFRLDTLDYPDKKDGRTDVLNYPAVQLLMHYARLSRPDLIFDEPTLDGIVEVCRLVQGMPLALVLAAGWVEVLSFAEIAAEIEQNLDFLESQARDVPERQRSVRAAFNYSWKCLTPEGQEVFASLSVFREGFTRHAAEQVAGAGIKILRHLIDRSFLVMRHNGRYDIHQLLRQFGEQVLQSSGQAEQVYARHSRYFLGRLADLEIEIKGLNQLDALDQIDADFANFRAAWDWAVIHREDEDINRAVESLYLFFSCRSHYVEGVEFLGSSHKLLTPVHREEPPLVCGRVLARYAWILALHREANSKTDRYIQQCMRLALKSGDQHEIAFSYLLLGFYHLYAKQEPLLALAHLERSYHIYLSLNDTFYTAITLFWLGSCHAEATGLDLMMAYSLQSYEMAKNSGNKAVLPFTLRNLARGALYSGDYQAAEQYNQEASIYQERMGLRIGLSESKTELGLLHFLNGELDEALHLAEEGLEIGRQLGYMWAVSEGLATLSLCEAVSGEAQSSCQLAEESLKIPSSLFSKMLAHWALATAKCALGQFEQSWEHLLEALLHANRLSYYAVQVWPLPVAVCVLANIENDELAVTVTSYAENQPLNCIGWTSFWQPYHALKSILKGRLGHAAYDTAWQRGKTLGNEDIFSRLSEIAVDPVDNVIRQQ